MGMALQPPARKKLEVPLNPLHSPRGAESFRRRKPVPTEPADQGNPFKRPPVVIKASYQARQDARGLIPKVVQKTLKWDSINGSGPPSRRGFVHYQALRGHDFVFNKPC